ncbi:unnamed protein product, partial [Vitis vinifera]
MEFYALPFSLSFLSLSFSLLLLLSPSLSLSNDTFALSQFRSQTDVHGTLISNWTGADACSGVWRGVRCFDGRVAVLSLPSLSLRGPIDALSGLNQLRILDLQGNRLNGTVLPIANCTNLKLVYLAGNDFSGEIPPDFSSLRRLLRLDLSDNNLRGPIPGSLSSLPRLLTLRLENNVLSGQVPDLSASLPNLKELNLSNNGFYGHLPEGMAKKFGDRSFQGNEGLCGSSPLPACSFTEASPTAASAQTGLSPGAIVAIVIANSAGSEGGRRRRSGSSSASEKKKVYASNGGGADSDGTNATDRSKLVFFDRRKQFELEDLLRASAEMLGKGSLGTVYKAVLDDGCTVAVKRLKDANPCARKEFEQYMDVIGKLKHPNIVRFRAYYYAKEEKLLVYDYLPNGSLHSLLHGNRGPGRIPLDWTTRISLVLGAARGLARIHEEYTASKIPHGNVKSSNILLDKNGVACISDFGLALLLNPVHATARLGGYRAPEQLEIKRLSQKADVYSFGVLLLEVLTGRAPSQYPSPSPEVFDQELLRYKNIEEELVAMLQVGMACVVPQPEKRPTMSEVAKMIEDIRVEQSPLGEEYDESRNSLSPSLATTEDGLAGY